MNLRANTNIQVQARTKLSREVVARYVMLLGNLAQKLLFYYSIGFQLSAESNAELLWSNFTIHSYDWFEILRHLLNQRDAKPKPIVTWSHAFSRAWRRLRAFASSSHWFIFCAPVMA